MASDLAWADNLFSFAACSRGFLEGAADTNDALNPVAYTLARDHGMIYLPSAYRSGGGSGVSVGISSSSKPNRHSQSLLLCVNQNDRYVQYSEEP
jgi:hypothetical protein